MFKWILIIVGILIVFGGALMLLRGSEDTWVKNESGVWEKHGNPSNVPDEVQEQQDLIAKAKELYQEAVDNGEDLSSGPCLGQIADDWSADLVHNPRTSVDDETENQCTEYHQGITHHYIELDMDGNVFWIQ